MPQLKTRKPPADTAPYSLLSDYDIHLLRQGRHFQLYQRLRAHMVEREGVHGTQFAVWAPNAESGSLGGRFTNWQGRSYRLHRRADDSGIWEGFIAGVGAGALYKYRVTSRHGNAVAEKADPFARRSELAPHTASMVWPRHGLHARRAAAGDGASVLWLVGLSDHGLLRAERALRNAAGLHVPGRYAAPGRHRRDPRLGTVAFSHRRARARVFRRHLAVRTRRPARRRPPGRGR